MTDQEYMLDHPIVFLFDFSNEDVAVPKYESTSVTAANSGCISIRVSSYVDGGVRIRLIGGPQPANVEAEPVKAYEGKIAAPSKSISLVSSLNERLAEVSLDSEEAGVTIYVDDEISPSAVTIVVTSL